MKTSVIEVRDMLSVLSVLGVEERIGEVPGVESVTVNYAAGSATVRYDETRLAAGDIKAAVHQSGNESAGESQPKHGSEHKPAVNGHEDHAAPDAKLSMPVAAVPKAAPVAPAAVPAPGAPALGGHQDHAAPDAKPSTPVAAVPKAAPVAPAVVPAPAPPAVGGLQDRAAPDAKPSTPVVAVPKAAPVAPAAVRAPAPPAVDAAPVAKSSTPATAEPKADSWKVHALSLATTLGVAYISCAIFDVLFPPFGLLSALAPASPWPISGSPFAFLTGFALFSVSGFVFGALYGIASKFWSKRLR